MLGTGREDLEDNQRLESLKAWSQQIIVCTVDTVLGLIQNQRRGLFSYPTIAASAFVFDEIHNYDAKLFAALVRFLQEFPNSPTLLMSASIPQPRLRTLREALGDRVAEPIEGERYLENLPRYRLEWKESCPDCRTELKRADMDGKVLWVCNTVKDAVSLYQIAGSLTRNASPLLYHSQFRYKDRVAPATRDRRVQETRARHL